MNRVRHLNSPKNLDSAGLTVRMRATKLTQEGWAGKSFYHGFLRQKIIAKKLHRGALPKRLVAGSKWALIAMHLAKTFWLFDYITFFPSPSHRVPSQRLYENTSRPSILVDMARGQAKSNNKNKGRQLPVLKDQGEVHTAGLS